MPTPGHTKDADRNLLLGVVLVAATLAAYVPAMRGGFIWDDDYYVSDNQTLRTTDGLRRIWLEPGAVPQYYPLVHTTYWVEYRLWQDWAPGYHAVNVVLHALSALLVATALRRLQVPGAWFAALLFALHPVHVESVAWITERKNVLSGLFYLLAVLAYCRFANLDSNPARPGRCWGCYTLALALFLCALLSKTVTASLPAALLLLIWWKRGRIGGRDIAPLVPFFALGIALGLVTVWMEKHHVGAQGELWHLALAERLLVAGRAAWFYAGKL
ncbi:MAG: hypothetical protein KKB50_17685 [Planctomycetes bacterium]|nr:hypothetical protein [Planctomycetota bacterium]